MKDFILAALPWVAMGIALALTAVSFAGKRKRRPPDGETAPDVTGERERREEGGGYPLCLGMCFGTAIGAALQNRFGPAALTYGICFGLLLGAVAELCFRRK